MDKNQSQTFDSANSQQKQQQQQPLIERSQFLYQESRSIKNYALKRIACAHCQSMICKCLCVSFNIDPLKSIYRDFFVRFASFSHNNWPSNHTLHPYVLAKCGFFVSSNQNDELITTTGRQRIPLTDTSGWLSIVNSKLCRMVSHAKLLFKWRGRNNEEMQILPTTLESHRNRIRIQCYHCQYGRFTLIDNHLTSSSSSSSNNQSNTLNINFLQQHRYVSPECKYAKINI